MRAAPFAVFRTMYGCKYMRYVVQFVLHVYTWHSALAMSHRFLCRPGAGGDSLNCAFRLEWLCRGSGVVEYSSTFNVSWYAGSGTPSLLFLGY